MLTRDDLILLIRLEITKARSQRNLARQWDVSPAYITDLLRGLRDPGPKILQAMGLERVTLYRTKEGTHDDHNL
jgi:hypothetical protein